MKEVKLTLEKPTIKLITNQFQEFNGAISVANV